MNEITVNFIPFTMALVIILGIELLSFKERLVFGRIPV